MPSRLGGEIHACSASRVGWYMYEDESHERATGRTNTCVLFIVRLCLNTVKNITERIKQRSPGRAPGPPGSRRAGWREGRISAPRKEECTKAETVVHYMGWRLWLDHSLQNCAPPRTTTTVNIALSLIYSYRLYCTTTVNSGVWMTVQCNIRGHGLHPQSSNQQYIGNVHVSRHSTRAK